jgi:hypothetical protein
MQTPLASDVQPRPTHRDQTGGMIEGLFALAAIVLAIIGLAGGPRFFDAIATIAIGGAFLFETWTVAASATERDIWAARLAGWAGVLLGLVVLRWLGPTVFIPIALLAFGVGLVFSTGLASGPVGLAIGSAAIALGFLAIVPLHPRMLTLIGIIAVGGVLLLTGPTTAWRLRGDATPAV